jgi:hypothetical protein
MPSRFIFEFRVVDGIFKKLDTTTKTGDFFITEFYYHHDVCAVNFLYCLNMIAINYESVLVSERLNLFSVICMRSYGTPGVNINRHLPRFGFIFGNRICSYWKIKRDAICF